MTYKRSLADPLRMREVLGLVVPHDFYWVWESQPAFAGMVYPKRENLWSTLAQSGFHEVVCLTHDDSLYDPSPLEFAFAAQLEDLMGGGRPVNPSEEEYLTYQATEITMQSLRNQKGVVVHCLGGIGRTGTVIGCVLVGFGYEPGKVIKWLDVLTRVRHPREKRKWPESEWQGKVVRDIALRLPNPE